jgi:hypothetical protein
MHPGVGVAIHTGNGVAVRVGVTVLVVVGVPVAVGVKVTVGVSVTVGVCVTVGVLVAANVPVGVAVLVAVGVLVTVAVLQGVTVAVTTNGPNCCSVGDDGESVERTSSSPSPNRRQAAIIYRIFIVVFPPYPTEQADHPHSRFKHDVHPSSRATREPHSGHTSAFSAAP